MDWSHVLHILTPLWSSLHLPQRPHLCIFSTRFGVTGIEEGNEGTQMGRQWAGEEGRGGNIYCILQDWEWRRSSAASERVTSLWEGGHQPVHTGGEVERGCACVCVRVCDGGGPPVPLRMGGRLPLCHRTSSKHFREAASKKRTRLHGYTIVHVNVPKNCKIQRWSNTGCIIWDGLLTSHRGFSITQVCRASRSDLRLMSPAEVDH